MGDSSVHAAAGALGGIVATAVTYPLINVSMRAQVARKQGKDASTLEALRELLQREGVQGLFAGVTSNLLGIAITNYTFYLTFEEARSAIMRAKNTKTLSTLQSIAASSIAGAATSIITNPIWVVSTMQSTSSNESLPLTQPGGKVASKKLNMLQTAKRLYEQDGILGFWRGLGPALILIINPIISYTSFEQLKNLIIAYRAAKGARVSLPVGKQGVASRPASVPLSDLDNFMLGALTKLLATGVTYPYVSLKTRLQAGKQKYSGSMDALNTIISEEGIGALYRGIAPKLIQSMLTAAFLFASKERFYLLAKAAIRTTAKAVPAAA